MRCCAQPANYCGKNVDDVGSVGHGPKLFPTRGRDGRAPASDSTKFYCCLQARLPNSTTLALGQATTVMAFVDAELDAFTDPLPKESADVIDESYTFQTGWACSPEPVTGVIVQNRRLPDGTCNKRLISYTSHQLSDQQLSRHLREERCTDCKQRLPVGREFFSQPHCCIKAYLFNAQRHIHRCMMEMRRADAQRLRCQALLNKGKVAMIIELQFTFHDGWIKQAFVTSNDYYEIVRRTVTKEDLEQWKPPFAPLDKVSFLTYPAQCKFTQRIYDRCAAAGILTDPPDETDGPVKFAVREADGGRAQLDRQPVSPQPNEQDDE